MSKNLKKILVTGASLLMFASVGAGASCAHAAHVSLGGGIGPVERALRGSSNWRAYRGTFRQYGYIFNEIHGAPANYIVGINGNRHVSNHQVMIALRGGNPFYRVNPRTDPYAKGGIIYKWANHKHSNSKAMPVMWNGRLGYIYPKYINPKTHSIEPNHIMYHYHKSARKHYRKHIRKHYFKHVVKHHKTYKARKARKTIKKHYRKHAKRSNKRLNNYYQHKAVNDKRTKAFMKSSTFKNEWTKALQIDNNAGRILLNKANQAKRHGNNKSARNLTRKANNLFNFAKHDKNMLKLNK